MADTQPSDFVRWYSQAKLFLLLTAGIVIGQAVLYGPALLGSKILLPLGCLTEGSSYIPHQTGAPEYESPQPVLLDLVTLTEPERRFAAREFSSGRFPSWSPHEFGGVPFIWPKYSPFYLLSALSQGPDLIPLAQLLLALVAGYGAFAFCRRVLRLSYWPSTLAAWCYPITGWFVLFQGYTTGAPVAWLPCLLYAIDRTVRGNHVAGVGVAITTALVLVSGHLDVAGQVLMVAGIFTLWCVWDVHRKRSFHFLKCKSGLALPLGFFLGLLLAAPFFLPIQEYARTSNRFARRGHGVEERPPVGLIAVPQIVLPDMYGVYAEKGVCPLLEPIEANQLESPAECYVGLLATLLLAPWAFLDRRRRSANVFFVALAGFGLSWVLEIPGIVQVLRLPGLNLMSHNRLVFATAFSILVLAAVGCENLLSGQLTRRPRLGAQFAILIALLGWCVYRSSNFPEPLASDLEARIRNGNPDIWVTTASAVLDAKTWFAHRYEKAAVLCGAGLAIWLLLHFRPSENRRVFPLLGTLLVADLLLFGYGKRIPQDRSLYFPEIPALKELAAATPGRMLGIDCLPANLAQAVGLMDIRGYDSVDPRRWLNLLWTATTQKTPQSDYAAVQFYTPRYTLEPPGEIRFSPVLDMLSVRYAVFRGKPGPGVKPLFQSNDYWVLENRAALPRVFIPRRVKAIPDDDETLRRLALPGFNAQEIAYVEAPLDLPTEIRGSAEIKEEIPTRIEIDAQMETPGLLVLADRWDVGWQAYVNGARAPILQTNYAIRGVTLPAGASKVEFRYEPSRLAIGNALALGTIAVLLAWTGLVVWRRRKATPVAVETSA